jgi:hypothetical protein
MANMYDDICRNGNAKKRHTVPGDSWRLRLALESSVHSNNCKKNERGYNNDTIGPPFALFLSNKRKLSCKTKRPVYFGHTLYTYKTKLTDVTDYAILSSSQKYV